jgi:hypothetical protein
MEVSHKYIQPFQCGLCPQTFQVFWKKKLLIKIQK